MNLIGKKFWGNSGGDNRRESRANCEWSPICLLLFRIDGVGINGEKVVAGVRSYACRHSLCGCERREIFKGRQRGGRENI